MKPITHKVFVYGTLMRGHGNHAAINQPATRFLGDAKTQEKYHLTFKTYPSGSGFRKGIPYVSDIIETEEVYGELYEVTEQTLHHHLDPLEGHPSFYRRKQINVTDDKGQIHEAWLYFCVGAETVPGAYLGFYGRENSKVPVHNILSQDLRNRAIENAGKNPLAAAKMLKTWNSYMHEHHKKEVYERIQNKIQTDKASMVIADKT